MRASANGVLWAPIEADTDRNAQLTGSLKSSDSLSNTLGKRAVMVPYPTQVGDGSTSRLVTSEINEVEKLDHGCPGKMPAALRYKNSDDVL